MGLDDQVKYRLELYLALKVPIAMVETSKESDKVRGRDRKSFCTAVCV